MARGMNGPKLTVIVRAGAVEQPVSRVEWFPTGEEQGGYCEPLKGWESPGCRYHSGVIKIPSGDKGEGKKKKPTVGSVFTPCGIKWKQKQQSVALASDLVPRHVVAGGRLSQSPAPPPLSCQGRLFDLYSFVVSIKTKDRPDMCSVSRRRRHRVKPHSPLNL